MERASYEPFGVELNEENLIDQEKKLNFSFECKIITSLIILFVIFSTIIIVISFSYENEYNTKEEIFYLNISCIYNVLNHSNLLPILSEEFPEKELQKFDIYINGTKLEKTSKNIIIYSNGFIEIYFIFHEYSKIYLENIFKDVPNLISIKIDSTSNVKILSIKRAFENCENLENITFKGFNTSEITSMHKLFYNNPYLNKIDLDDTFSTKNVQDMSYMFAKTHISELNTKNFITTKTKNMSNMFYGCDQ